MGPRPARLTLVLATLLGVVVVVGAAGAFAVGRSQHSAARVTTTPGASVLGTTPADSPTRGATGGAVGRTPGRPSPVGPAQSASVQPSATPMPSESGGASAGASAAPSAAVSPPRSSGDAPFGPVAVTLSASAEASPDAQPVEDLLTRYYTAINRHDYDAWLTTVSTSQAKRNRDDWTEGYSTTRDSDVYVSDIYTKGSNLLVRIQFVSHQAVQYAPTSLPVDCIRWDVTYLIVDEGTGLRVGNSADKPSMAPCA